MLKAYIRALLTQEQVSSGATFCDCSSLHTTIDHMISFSLVAGAWTEREKMYHGGSFLKLADDDMDIQNPEAQNRELGGF